MGNLVGWLKQVVKVWRDFEELKIFWRSFCCLCGIESLVHRSLTKRTQSPGIRRWTCGRSLKTWRGRSQKIQSLYWKTKETSKQKKKNWGRGVNYWVLWCFMKQNMIFAKFHTESMNYVCRLVFPFIVLVDCLIGRGCGRWWRQRNLKRLMARTAIQANLSPKGNLVFKWLNSQINWLIWSYLLILTYPKQNNWTPILSYFLAIGAVQNPPPSLVQLAKSQGSIASSRPTRRARGGQGTDVSFG